MTENNPKTPTSEIDHEKMAKIEAEVSPNDIILIVKPDGLSSFGVVARVRRVLSEQAGKKIKVGHTGTLDPFATGLLILLANKATKLSNQFLKLDKWYEATIRLGKVSTTGDPEGEITDFVSEAPRENLPDRNEIEQVIKKFVGKIQQTVPSFSAVKINGQRAYQLARRGEVIEMPTRTVEIYTIKILEYHYPDLVIRTHVSSGTYIRTLGEDIGKALNTGAYLTALRRTKIGDFDIAAATKLVDFMSAEEIDQT